MRATRVLLSVSLLIIGSIVALPLHADDLYCCAYCQGGSGSQTFCVVGDCFWYAEQKCYYQQRPNGTVCRTMADPLSCPRSTFSADPWSSEEESPAPPVPMATKK